MSEKSKSELEAGFEVSKILAHNGFDVRKPALIVTYGQIAEKIGDTLAAYGLPADRLDDGMVVNLIEEIKESLGSTDVLSWDQVVQDMTLEVPEVSDLLPQYSPEEDDCPMDGDHESALASVGWGTDEDYGCFSDPYEDF